MSLNFASAAYCRTYQAVFRQAVKFMPWRQPDCSLKGAGSVKKLAEFIKEKGLKKPLIVTDKGLINLGLVDGLFNSIKEQGYDYALFDGVVPNPTTTNIEDAYSLYKSENCDCIVAMGGGSSMDCAKMCGARVVNPTKSVAKMKGVLKVGKRLPPFFAIPTTAGTGSETTIAAVISDAETHVKYTVMDPHIVPDYAVLDPELTLGLPPSITAATGMDALTHAVEAYIGKSNTVDTREKARLATKMIFEYLPIVMENGKSVNAREEMLQASYYAGVAFTRAYVGYIHAIAHAIGGLYGYPHGLACTVVMPYVLEYYGDSCKYQLADLADQAGVEGDSVEEKAKNFIAAIRKMNADFGMPEGFDKLEEKDFDEICSRALAEGNPLYPVPKLMGADDMKGVLKQLLVK